MYQIPIPLVKNWAAIPHTAEAVGFLAAFSVKPRKGQTAIGSCPSLAPDNRSHPSESATRPVPTAAASRGPLESPNELFSEFRSERQINRVVATSNS
jgi:hypothetical protein